MDYKKLPKHEDVTDINLGSGHRAAIVKITDENKESLLEVIMSQYLGETCPFCLAVFGALEDLDGSVWCPSEYGRIAHKKCWDVYGEAYLNEQNI